MSSNSNSYLKTSVTMSSSVIPAATALGCWNPDFGNPDIDSTVVRPFFARQIIDAPASAK